MIISVPALPVEFRYITNNNKTAKPKISKMAAEKGPRFKKNIILVCDLINE